MTDKQQLNWAIGAIVEAADRSKPGSFLQYAAQYALHMRSMELGTTEMHTQALYTLSNLQYWRGETAKKVKQLLKEL